MSGDANDSSTGGSPIDSNPAGRNPAGTTGDRAAEHTPGAPADPPSEYVTVDAARGSVVRLETFDGQTYALPARWLPAGAGEGDVLQVCCVRIAGSMELRLALDPAATARARRRVRAKLDQLRQRDEE